MTSEVRSMKKASTPLPALGNVLISNRIIKKKSCNCLFKCLMLNTWTHYNVINYEFNGIAYISSSLYRQMYMEINIINVLIEYS